MELTLYNLVIIADDEEVEEVYANLEETHTMPHDSVITMVDFNVVVSKDRGDREVGDFGLGRRKRRAVVGLRRVNGLVLTNAKIQNLIRRIYSWKILGDIFCYQIN